MSSLEDTPPLPTPGPGSPPGPSLFGLGMPTPPGRALAAKPTNQRNVRRQNQQSQRQHPQAKQRQKPEQTADNKQRAEDDAHERAARKRDLGAAKPYLWARLGCPDIPICPACELFFVFVHCC